MENKDNAKVNLMARAGSRTRKYQARQTRQAPAPAPALNYHRAMPTTHTTGYPIPPMDEATLAVHTGGQNTLQQPPPPLNLTRVVATAPAPLPGAVASSSSQNRSSGNRCAKVCEGCGGTFDPNAPMNSKEAFLYGDKYCGACLLGFQNG